MAQLTFTIEPFGISEAVCVYLQDSFLGLYTKSIYEPSKLVVTGLDSNGGLRASVVGSENEALDYIVEYVY